MYFHVHLGENLYIDIYVHCMLTSCGREHEKTWGNTTR